MKIATKIVGEVNHQIGGLLIVEEVKGADWSLTSNF